jgi:PleD family two-component response regulator
VLSLRADQAMYKAKAAGKRRYAVAGQGGFGSI